jgi:hypothetical protein
LERVWCVYPGAARYAMHAQVEAAPVKELPEIFAALATE